MRNRPRPRKPQKHRALGVEIVKMRGRHRLSQRELAADLGVSSRTLLRWENGYALPTKGQLTTLVAYLAQLDEDDAEHVAATYGTSLDLLGIVRASDAPAGAPSPSPVTPEPPREAAELALYVAADELGMRPARLRAPVVTMLRTLGALGLTCEKACAMIEAGGERGAAPGESSRKAPAASAGQVADVST